MEVTIERILPGGLGLAHSDGQTVMVALAAPGDRVRVRVDRTKGSVAFASIEEIISPSPSRVEAPCPYFGRCGGCDFQQLTYDAQLAAKAEIIKDCLRRIGGVQNIPDFEIRRAPNEWHYRSRAQWQYDSIRKRLGYFESGSRRVCDVAECAVLAPQLQSTLENLRGRMRDDLLSDEARYFRAVLGDDEVSISSGVSSLTDRGSRKGGPRGVFERESRQREIRRRIHGESYTLNAESFFQTNVDLLPALIEAALADERGEMAVELYCGVGLFTIPLARRFARVIAVEDDREAAHFARQNVAAAKLPHAEILNDDVGDWLEKNLQEVDFLLLDPPRTGAESRVINGILRLRPQHISYVSCDPATLARDLKKLFADGYTLDSLVPLDMFPQTHHVETIVHLRG